MKSFLSLLLVLSVPVVAQCCWMAIDPGGFALDCPIIVRGAIVAGAKAVPGRSRADDLAEIRVDQIQKNELNDVPLKVGGTLKVRMVSRNNQMHTSTDINYPAGTEGVWLVFLNRHGEFRIDIHPVQKQPPGAKFASSNTAREKRVGEVTQEGKSTQDWIADVRAREAREAKAREESLAREKEIRALAREMAETPEITGTSTRRYHEADREVRRAIFQLRGVEQPLKGKRLVEFVDYVLKSEPDDNVRVFAASLLGYTPATELPVKAAGAVLGRMLTDPSRDVRLFSCQALKFLKDQNQAVAVRKLLQDEKEDMRRMAVETLAWMDDRAAIPLILELARREGAQRGRTGEFANALARLGDTENARLLLRQALQSDDLNDRHHAIRGLPFLDEKQAVPLVMDFLVVEFQRVLPDLKTGGGQTYHEMCQLLEKAAQQRLNNNLLGWLTWWERSHKLYNAPVPAIDRETARRLWKEHEQARPK
jgi:HEAT repeat protein